MKKQIFIFAFLLCLFASAKAQVVQTLNLKNGSVLYGFIKNQKPGSNIIFASEKAIIVMDGKSVREIIPRKVGYKTLSDEWKHWAEENEVLYGLGDSREMTLSTIMDASGHTVSDVYILERGQHVKYAEFSRRDYSLDWSDIVSIEYAKRPNTLLSGVNRSLTVKSGNMSKTVIGQCLKEIPGVSTYLLEEDGVVESFDMNDIIKDNSIKNNPNQSIFEQSPLLDEIQMKNGSVYKGIVTERNYEENLNYFLITSLNGDVEYTTSLKMADVAEFRKLPNPDFKQVFDILLRPGDLVVNRNEVEKVKLTESNDKFEIKPDMKRLDLKRKGASLDLDVESNFKNNRDVQNYLLIRTHKITNDKKKTDYYEFSYADMIKSSLSPNEIVTSMNNTTKLSYFVNSPALYVLFNKETKEAVLINVE